MVRLVRAAEARPQTGRKEERGATGKRSLYDHTQTHSHTYTQSAYFPPHLRSVEDHKARPARSFTACLYLPTCCFRIFCSFQKKSINLAPPQCAFATGGLPGPRSERPPNFNLTCIKMENKKGLLGTPLCPGRHVHAGGLTDRGISGTPSGGPDEPQTNRPTACILSHFGRACGARGRRCDIQQRQLRRVGTTKRSVP